MKKITLIWIGILSALWFLYSCEDDKYVSSTDAKLVFSLDTIRFDTIFTTIGSTTQHLKVYNPYDRSVLISSIRLSGNSESKFRLNIDGEPSDEVIDVELGAMDSLYVFIEVTIDPLGENQPIIVKDSIEFVTNMNQQFVKLEAWGQDIELVNGEIREDTRWTAERPYVVNANIEIASKATLVIDPGSKVHFHKGTGMYVKGSLQVNGDFERPVLFQSDRLEDVYKEVPDQWNGILLYSGSTNSRINFADIKNANIGLQVGNIENEGIASVSIENCKIYNHAYAGIFALNSKITAVNCLIYNCGFYAAALLIGGEYEFYHSTIANYWGGYSSRVRTTSSLMISDHVVVEQSNGTSITYASDLKKAYFVNSIVTGNVIGGSELQLASSGEQEFNFRFENCLLQLADTFNISNSLYYHNIIKNGSPLFVDPYSSMNFQLDTLSDAKDVGLIEIGAMFPKDLLNQLRTVDKAPDLGAYERLENDSN